MNMMLQTRTTLPTYLMHLQSEGRITFTRAGAIAALGLSEGAFLKAAARLQRRGLLLNPRQGFYVAVPPQYLSWGAPPPAWYVDALMHHEGRPYYVGLLKAAELHGATHQAVMEFQVVTDRQLPKIRAGRSFITFHYRKDLKAVRDGVGPHKTDTGSMMVSSPELTALDLVRYSRAAGGLDAVATILVDLGETLDGARLAALAAHFERAVAQRLGYLLERLGHGVRAELLHEALVAQGRVPWTALEPPKRGPIRPAQSPVERNERWHVTIRRHPDIDQ
jgi:predicted transcriptional regulator of viral defense system